MKGVSERNRHGAWFGGALALIAGLSLAATDRPEPGLSEGPFKPTDESLKQYQCPDWFRDAKLGIWAVWGPEAVPMQGDWYARNLYLQGGAQNKYHVEHYGHPSKFGFKDIIPLWKAEKWEPERLMALYQKAGAKYFCMIAMHHDNFDCWDSKFQRWNSLNMGPRRDVAGEWQQAARKYGLRFGMTEHLAASWWFYSAAKGADTNGPMAGAPYDGTDPKYAELYWSGNEKPDGNYYLPNAPDAVKRTWFNRVTDMVDRYHPDLIYSDSPLPYPADYGRKMLAHFYNDNLQRHAGKLEAIYNCKEDSQGRWVQDLERGVMPGISPHPWQTDTCVGGWYYQTGGRYKSSATVLQMLADIVSKNGNLLLNFPPRPDGTLDEQEHKILADLGAWMPINGEAIFGTRPWTVYGEGPARAKGGMFNEDQLRYSAQDIRFTTKGDALYALVLGWPEDRRVVVHSLATGAGNISAVHLLGYAGPIAAKQTVDGLFVTLPEQKPCEHVFALKVEGRDLKPVAAPAASAIAPDATGRIVLGAADAQNHGSSPQYEQGGGKDQIGYWADPHDFVSWEFKAAAPGVYTVSVVYSCDPGAEGSEYAVEVGAETLVGASKPTGSWSTYATATLGALRIERSGAFTLNVKPKIDRVPWKVIGLSKVILSPSTFADASPPPVSPLTLWYRQPAQRWLESLPVGNGRFGAMVFGGVTEERLELNEATFWSGAASEEHENPEALNAFTRIRELFKAGKNQETAPLIDKMLGRKLNYGTSLPAGCLLLKQSGTDGEVGDYRRELDLKTALAKVTFSARGARFSREVLASHPDGVVAVRLSADRPRSISFELRYVTERFPWTGKLQDKATLVVSGRALERNHSDGKSGVAFQAMIRVLPEGGAVTNGEGSLIVAGADSVIVLIAMNTDFQGGDPAVLSARQIEAAQRKSWAALRDGHVADHQRLFERVAIDLGGSRAAGEPIDIRLNALRKGQDDPQFAALFFQYGRYLTIAASREDSPLPMHLQGLWNDGLAADMGWTCDYHLDINTQQNYWLTEVANLRECGEPLFRFIESLQAPGRSTARKVYGIDHGWVCHVFTDPWGYTAPGWGGGWGLHVTGGAWLANHLWEDYLFAGDRDFLAKQAYPTLKGAAEFFLDYLYADPTTGWLLTGPSVSPERGGETNPGCVHDRAIVSALFGACIEASRALGVDEGFRARLEAAQAKLPPYKIGRNGQLQEFQDDDGGETNHRHTSHLVGLFPLAQITPRGTPALARSVERSLHLRMDRSDWEDVEWSAGNSVCYYARLGNGEFAHKNLTQLLTSDTDTDLLTFSRGGIAGAPQNIFVIDGNTSGAAGIAEMLLQSHAGEIELLPALPKAWLAGSFRGLRARGGFEVDLEWKAGALISATIHNRSGSGGKLRYGDRAVPFTILPGQALKFDGELRFASAKGSPPRADLVPKDAVPTGHAPADSTMDSVKSEPLVASQGVTLALSSPQDYQVFQRASKDMGAIEIAGECAVPDAQGTVIEARIIAEGKSGEWKELSAAPPGSRFSSKLEAPAGGWYRVEVRILRGGRPLAESSVEHVGVGEVFVVSGQSNATNYGAEKLTPETGLVAAYDGRAWRIANDPQGGCDGSDGGSFIPAFGDAMVRRYHVPIGVASTGQGATSVRQWLPQGARVRQEPTTGGMKPVGPGEWESNGVLFDRLLLRCALLGPKGFRAVLWHQGESDAGQARAGYPADRQITGEQYFEFMSLLIRASREKAGWPIPWFTAQTTYHVGDPSDAEFRAAMKSLWDKGVSLEGPDTDALREEYRSGVHFNGKGQRAHGRLWADKVGLYLDRELAKPTP